MTLRSPGAGLLKNVLESLAIWRIAS